MTQRVANFVIAVLGLGGCAAGWYGARADAGPAASAGPSPATQPSFAAAFPAMDYYDQSCAKCHGPGGSFYGPTLGNDLTDAGLVKKCHAMEVGPGNAPLSDEQNTAVVAYHRSLILHLPFVSVTDASTPQWTGEVTPGAKVVLDLPKEMIPVVVTDYTWTAAVPVNIRPQDVIVKAELRGKVTELKLGDSAFSAAAPLPPVGQRPKQ